jgi:hypothetical protein
VFDAGLSDLFTFATGEISSVDHEVTGFPGDVTFDLKMDVRDVIKEVKIVLGTTEMDGPFTLFDVTRDSLINVVDIVNMIHKILNSDYPTRIVSSDRPVTITIDNEVTEDPVLHIESAYGIAGIQLVLSLRGITWNDIEMSHTVAGMDIGEATDKGFRTIVFYSMEGNYIPAGSSEIIRLLLPDEMPDGVEIVIEEAVAVHISGREIPVVLENNTFRPNSLPTDFALNQNFPNPFNPSTVIRYDLPESGHVVLTVYNMLGQRVATLVNEVQPAGRHTAVWGAGNDSGHPVASGLYLYRITAGNRFSEVRKMMLVR